MIGFFLFLICIFTCPFSFSSSEKSEANYYEILNLSRDATPQEIKSSFKKLVLQFHPDQNSDPGAVDQYRKIVEAFNVLSDQAKKSQYDVHGNSFEVQGDLDPRYSIDPHYGWNLQQVRLQRDRDLSEMIQKEQLEDIERRKIIAAKIGGRDATRDWSFDPENLTYTDHRTKIISKYDPVRGRYYSKQGWEFLRQDGNYFNPLNGTVWVVSQGLWARFDRATDKWRETDRDTGFWKDFDTRLPHRTPMAKLFNLLFNYQKETRELALKRLKPVETWTQDEKSDFVNRAALSLKSMDESVERIRIHEVFDLPFAHHFPILMDLMLLKSNKKYSRLMVLLILSKPQWILQPKYIQWLRTAFENDPASKHEFLQSEVIKKYGTLLFTDPSVILIPGKNEVKADPLNIKVQEAIREYMNHANGKEIKFLIDHIFFQLARDPEPIREALSKIIHSPKFSEALSYFSNGVTLERFFMFLGQGNPKVKSCMEELLRKKRKQ